MDAQDVRELALVHVKVDVGEHVQVAVVVVLDALVAQTVLVVHHVVAVVDVLAAQTLVLETVLVLAQADAHHVQEHVQVAQQHAQVLVKHIV